MKEMKPMRRNWTHKEKMKPMRTHRKHGTCVYHCVKSLAKLLHGIVASASISHGQVACRNLQVTLAPQGNTCPRWQLTEPEANVSSWYDLWSSVSPASMSLYSFCTLDKTPMGLIKTLLFWVLTDWFGPSPETRKHYTHALKACAPGPASLCLLSALTSCVAPRGLCELPPVAMSDKLL